MPSSKIIIIFDAPKKAFYAENGALRDTFA